MNSIKDSTTIIKYRKKKQFDCFDGKINFIIIYIFYDTCNCNNIRHSIVASITACHAVDRRSIRRDGDHLFATYEVHIIVLLHLLFRFRQKLAKSAW